MPWMSLPPLFGSTCFELYAYVRPEEPELKRPNAETTRYSRSHAQQGSDRRGDSRSGWFDDGEISIQSGLAGCYGKWQPNGAMHPLARCLTGRLEIWCLSDQVQVLGAPVAEDHGAGAGFWGVVFRCSARHLDALPFSGFSGLLPDNLIFPSFLSKLGNLERRFQFSQIMAMQNNCKK